LRDVEETCEEVLILKDGHQVHYANLEEERRANRRFLELETLGGDGAFAEAVERLDCECAITGSAISAAAETHTDRSPRRFKMVLGQNFTVEDLYRLAEEHSVQIRRLNYRRDSLEDIFLKAMENSNGRP